MARFYDSLTPRLQAFVRQQRVFFTGSAPLDGGRVNVSPKGMDTLRILDPKRMGYLDLTGSGAETAAHVMQNARLTLMFCSFDAEPMILRVYGRGELVCPADPQWTLLRPAFPGYPGARGIVVLDIESVQTSCGFAVPLMDYRGERGDLVRWTERKGEEGLRRYRRQRNRSSIDGLPTGLTETED